MLRLSIPKEPAWRKIGNTGAEFLIKPLTSLEIEACRFRSQARIKGIKDAQALLREAGVLVIDGPDLADAGTAIGLAYQTFVAEIAQEAVQDWRGIIGEDGQPAPFAKDGLRSLVEIDEVAAFLLTLSAQTEAVIQEGNASRPSPDGNSGRAKAELTAPPANQEPA